MASDRFWMYKRLDNKGFLHNDFIRGVEQFVDFAFTQDKFVSRDKIKCPCIKCDNRKFQIRDDVIFHLHSKGFTSGYMVWLAHGESYSNFVHGESSRSLDEVFNPYQRMIMDSYFPEFDSAFGGSGFDGELLNHNAAKFFSLLKDTDEPLYPGCVKYTKLSAVAQLLNVKSEFNMSGTCFDRLLSIFKDMLPENDKLPGSFYKAKKMVTRLGLSYMKIHACPNYCMLFYAETESMTECVVCGHPRYKPSTQGTSSSKRNNIPYKVLRYLPLIPRLQRLYMSTETAEHMTWHVKNHSSDGVIRHPVDSEAWQHFDRTYPSFALETRSVRLGLCSDGFNPFGPSSKPYSCWPVILCVYNLPPWMCMKQPYLLLNMMIPGPKSPTKHIDVFLRPLIDELKILWNVGVETFDAFRKQNFQLRAALLWTINDFPAYAMLSGWSTHGRLACPYCMERSKAFWLDHGKKTSFFDCHRQFLPMDHSYRKQKDKFRKRVEKDPPIRRLSGEEMLSRVSVLPDVTFGTQLGKQKITGFGKDHNWVKRSIFWDLPYWESNLIRHNLDVMHIERNVFENIFYTVMNVKGKSKDNLKARLDLKVYCKRSELELAENNGKIFMPKAAFTLSKEQIDDVCKWVKQLKFPDGYVSNIAKKVGDDENKFYGLKSHDCHVFMQRLLPIAFKDLLPNPIWGAITELSHFFKDICSTELKVGDMETLGKNIVETLCKMEKIFPPGFFDSMEHLPIHLAYEAKVGGPVHFRWMYPFERCMHHFKKKVTNRASVEASICEAYIVEEISTFCSFYFKSDVPTRLNRVPRNDDGGQVESMGRLSIFTHPGRSFGSNQFSRFLTDDEYKTASLYVLLNCEEIGPYIEIFDEVKKKEIQNISDAQLEKLRETTFLSWLRNFVENNKAQVDGRIMDLSIGPSRFARFYNGYFVNGFKFHTYRYGQNRQTMNYGVCVKGSCYNDVDCDFYGVLVDIVELEYVGNGNKVVLFKCHWFDTQKGVKVHPHYGLIEVNHTSTLSTNEPFVLAQQAQQIYYTSYASRRQDRRDWWVVCKIKARSRFDIPLSENENQHESVDGFYQEEESTSFNVIPTVELDDPSFLVSEEGLEEVPIVFLETDEVNDTYDNEDDGEEEEDDAYLFEESEESEEDNIEIEGLEFNNSTSDDSDNVSEDIEVDD